MDEYQDSNQVQNCIFRALSDRERRLFAVGGVKQSIYRFRLADPTIFLEKYLSYVPASEAEEGQPRKVLLSRNFRSRREVLDGTNFVFRSVMSREMGEMDYGDDEQLYFGAEAAYPPRPGMEPELHFISVENTQEESFDRTEMEARFTARRIRRLLDEKFPVQGRTAGPGRWSRRTSSFSCAPPGQAGGLYGGSAAGEYPLHQRGKRGLLQHPGGGGDGVVFADHRQSPAGCAADRRAAVAAVRLFGGPPGPDPALQPEGTITAPPVPGRRRGHGGLPAAAGGAAAGGPGHDGGPPAVEALYGVPRPGGVRGHGGRSRPEGENLIALYTYAGQQAAAGRGGLFDFVTQLHDLLEEGRQPPITTRTAGSGCRS